MNCATRKTSTVFSILGTQPFPATGLLTGNLDSSLARIQKINPKLLANPTYVYIATTVKNYGGLLGQTGSAPNFQGDCITLCTCKHKDRSSWPPAGKRGSNPTDHWQGMWVAGLCSPSEFRPRALFYLMFLQASYDSHASMWNALRNPLSKSAHRHMFGDVYEPLFANTSAPWNASSYAAHLPAHVHDTNERRKDIEAIYHGRHPRLLLGEPKFSFLWSKPKVCLQTANDSGWKSAHHRFYSNLASFLATLQ